MYFLFSPDIQKQCPSLKTEILAENGRNESALIGRGFCRELFGEDDKILVIEI
jgi:hypothetical protein